MSKYPDYVEKCRQPGTNISCIRGKYYLYKCHSEYDKKKKKSKKITDEYIDRITEDGIIPPKRKQKSEISAASADSASSKEYGACSVVSSMCEDVKSKLDKHFKEKSNLIYVLALIRLLYRCPLKRVSEAYYNSFLSEMFKDLPLSSSNLSVVLKDLGQNRQQIVEFMKEFVTDDDSIIFDGTNIISNSEKMDLNRLGYNSHRQYDPQVNLMMAFSAKEKMPVFYRIVPGNVRDITAFKLTVAESELKNVTVIADKGFGSKANFEMLEENSLKYIVPLRRNNSMIKREILESGDKSKFDGYFLYHKKVIWYYSYNLISQE